MDRKPRTVEIGPDQVVVSKSLLRELRLRIEENEKRTAQEAQLIKRQLAMLAEDVKERPVVTPLISPTGRKSKCVELAKQRKKGANP